MNQTIVYVSVNPAYPECLYNRVSHRWTVMWKTVWTFEGKEESVIVDKTFDNRADAETFAQSLKPASGVNVFTL